MDIIDILSFKINFVSFFSAQIYISNIVGTRGHVVANLCPTPVFIEPIAAIYLKWHYQIKEQFFQF